MKPLILAVLVSTTAAQAQTKAQISGFVRDRSNAVVAGASVSVMNLDTGIRRVTRTNDEGFYAISSLNAGTYKITVRRESFQTAAHLAFPLQATEAGRADFVLELGSVREVINVEGGQSLLNLDDASSGVTMAATAAGALPLNGRALQGLVELAPGVLVTPATAGEAGQFSANGQRPNTNYFTVDGINANNGVSGSGLPGQFSGGALPAMTAIGSLHNLASAGELQEVRVQTSTYAPEYGRLPGAQVAVSTRSGSNEFRGQAFGSFRHERLSASGFFTNQAGFDRAPHRLNHVGGAFGGPIQQNKSFFLVSAEHLRLRQGMTFLTAVPDLGARLRAPAGVRDIINAYPAPNGPSLGDTAIHTAQYDVPSEVTATSARVDRALSDSGLVFVRFNRTPSTNQFGYLQSNAARFRSSSFTLGAISAIAGTITNDFRLGVSRTSVDSEWLPGAASIDLRRYLTDPGPGQQLYGVSIRGFGQLLTGDPGQSRQSLVNIVNSVALSRGTHDLRIGLDYSRLMPKREQAIATAVAVWDSLDDLLSGVPFRIANAQTGGGSSLIETLSLFAQDTWHATPRLNLTYGVRWEYTPPPSYQLPPVGGFPDRGGFARETTQPPLSSEVPVSSLAGPAWNSRATQFAPRFGAAYRLTESTVFRAGAGLFYDLGFSSAIDLVNGAPYNRWRTMLGPSSMPAVDEVAYGFAANLRLPYALEWNVSLERALTGSSAASVSYVGSSGRRLLRREGYVNRATNRPALVLATNNGTSDFHSLQLQYRSRDFRGLQGTVSYTWSHSIDNGSWDSASFLVYNPAQSGSDRGSSNFDVRHSFQAALSYDLGRIRGFGRWGRGWQLSTMLRARTGFPIDVVSHEDAFGLGFDNDVRPDLVPGQPIWQADPFAPGGRRLNAAAFRPSAGAQGTLGRNAIAGLGLVQGDFALQRQFSLSEAGSLRLRLEAYNVTNTSNFADPVRYLSNPLFGISPTLANLMLGSGRPNSGLSPAFQGGGARVLQVTLGLRF
jgi:hypothetical protein